MSRASKPSRALAGLLLLGALGRAEPAHAFCRTRTCEFDDRIDCEPDRAGCSTVGEFTFWDSSCIPYAIQRDGSAVSGISAEDFAPFVDAAFRAWSELSCEDGGTPPLAAASQGFIACDAVEYDCNSSLEENSNLFVFRDDFEDSLLGLRTGLIALTTTTADLRGGRIYDADVELNSRDELFLLEPPADPTDPSSGRDLQAVVTHEVGHLLGLSHSRERMALMFELYAGGAPGADDAAGMCATLGSASGDPACSAAALPADAACIGDDQSCTIVRPGGDDSGGCACALPGARSAPGGLAPLWLSLGALLVGGRAARRRAAQSASMLPGQPFSPLSGRERERPPGRERSARQISSFSRGRSRPLPHFAGPPSRRMTESRARSSARRPAK